jgi:protein-L-isoaspartate(D-aspartate) O-methyltransferase
MTSFSAARTAMVDRQVRPSDVTSFPIIDAMLRIPRERFLPTRLQEVAYSDGPVQIGQGREMLAPRTFAKMLDGARIGPDDLVLDIAPGLGYSTAIIAQMAAAVIAIEPDEEMAKAAAGILTALEVDNALLKAGDPLQGDAAHGPYDAVFVNGAVGRLPKALCDQLKDGGRLVTIETSGGVGRAVVYVRSGDHVHPRPLFDASAAVIPGFEREEEFAL